MKFIPFAAAAALVISGGSAFADVLSPGGLVSTGSTSFGNTPGTAGVASSFTDTLTFTIAGSYTFNGSVLSVVNGNQNVDFSSIALSGPTAVTFFKTNSDPIELWSAGSSLATAGQPVTISAGTYTLTLTGTNSAGQGSYAGNLAITAVPEPQSLALMLAGIGMVGFLARRRSV